MTDYQDTLVKFDPEKSERKTIRLENLPNNSFLISKPVSRDLIEDMNVRGQLTPIRLANTEKGTIVIAGNRRIKAARALKWVFIDALVSDMPYRDAMLARAAENNQRANNDISDVASIQMLLDTVDASMSAKSISQLTGINQGRVKSLLKMAKLPKRFTEAVMQGTMSEETFKKLSTMDGRYIMMAAQKFTEAASKWQQKEVADYIVWMHEGKEYLNAPSFLTGEDIHAIQQERVQQTINTQLEIPDMPDEIQPDNATVGFAMLRKSDGMLLMRKTIEELQAAYKKDDPKGEWVIVRLILELRL